MVQANGIVKAYGRRVLFDGASFTLGAGERAGLVGRNGSGKTTLFRMILGRELPDEGSISVPRDYKAGHLSQEIRFAADTVLAEAMLGLGGDSLPENQAYMAESVLMGLGFQPEDFSRHPHELSGGFQVRLNLAKLLLAGPNLLLLDEPTNYLDIVSSRWLGQFLKNWKGELMLITHDRDFMDAVTTHTIGIHRAKTRKIAGGTHRLYEQILAGEEVYERTRANDEKKRRELEEFINRFRAQATRARAVQSRIKGLQKKGRLDRLSAEKTLDFEFNYAPHESKWLMRAEDISFGYEPAAPLFENLNLSVGRRDRIAVIGRNGQGKTTLLKLLAGEIKPDCGSVSLGSRTAMAHFGQTNVSRLDPSRTVEEEILDSMAEHRRVAARNICGAMLFEGDDALKKISVLSGGEKSRVLLGKLIAQPANLLLLDEPTNHLDMESVDALVEAIEAFEGAVIMVTHSEMILRASATRLVVFDGGRARVFEGAYEDFLRQVGWKGEQAPKAAPGKNGGKTASRKDMRRLRAEIVAMRSKTLGDLQARIRGAEEEIITLEERMENDNVALIQASMKGDGGEIKRLSKSIHDAKERIEALFAELEAATGELGKNRCEFDARLAGLDERQRGN
ncbi:MAG: ATP-binding cassette domain-containing protein [Nitrospiraceae bacterium]|nr:ATP-binding cassette domain-containing protein [Nitrospiraceae bacterium]